MTAAETEAPARSRMRNRQLFTSARSGDGRDDWRTGDDVLACARAYAPIGCDPCASSDPLHHYAVVNYTVEDDGLTRSWLCDGVTFANVPYSQSRRWVDKAITEARDGASIILLTAARPGARWYRRAKDHADAIGEVRGRLTFIGATSGAPFPSAVIGLNVSWRRFAAAFAPIADTEVPASRVALPTLAAPPPARSKRRNPNHPSLFDGLKVP